ncbi:MAG: apolipoprotein N-acyltransferase [Cyanobacteria bacterium RYN_339]|nr:apolipoprotein N-acyltransferase [Cyanobacteria bacterium RYN_339]
MTEPDAPAEPVAGSHPEGTSCVPLTRGHVVTALLSGIALALSFPGVDLGFLAWFALVPFCLVAFRPRRRRHMVALFAAFGAGFYLTLLYWFLMMHPLTWLGFSYAESVGVVLFAWLGASLALVIQLLAFGALFGEVTKRWDKPGWGHVAALALGWTGLEWLASQGPFGFTWGNMALTQVHYLPMIQVLDLVGPFPLAGLIVAFNGAVAIGARAQAGHAWNLNHWKPVMAMVVPIVAVLAYGFARLSQPLPATTFTVEIVQGNIAGGDKFDKSKDAIYHMADHYLKLTDQHPKSDLVLWPETAMPAWMKSDMRLMGQLEHAVASQHRYLMTGTLDWTGDRPNQKFYNAVALFDPTGHIVGFDYKRHLVPYGEYLPGRAFMPAFLGSINILAMDFTPGDKPTVFNLPFGKIGAGVCYDGIFPDAMRPVVQAGAEVLTLVTNDAWYKDTTAPRVLNAHAALRAVENHRYVLRAANTGISSIIDAHGRVVASTPVYQDATLLGGAVPLTEITLYTRFGDWASQLAGLAFLGMIIWPWTQRRRRHLRVAA